MKEKSDDSKKKPKPESFEVIIGTTEICRRIGNVAPVTMLQMHYHEGLPIVNRDSVWWAEASVLAEWKEDKDASKIDERLSRVEEALAAWTKANRRDKLP